MRLPSLTIGSPNGIQRRHVINDCHYLFLVRLIFAVILGLISIHTVTTPYHPAANGMVELFHRQLKVALRAQPNPELWQEHLGFFLPGIRKLIKSRRRQCSAAAGHTGGMISL